MDKLRERIAAQKAELDRLRPLSPRGLGNLEHVHDLELTYTSITIGGKPLKDHMEAIDHHDAIRYVRELARRRTALREMDVRTLHGLVVKRSDPDIAGRYANQGRFILTDNGRHAFPSPVEVPALMGDFATWLAAAPDTPETAFTAHRRLVDIHPFNDGNGRTARLLMNLILLRGGYPPVAVRPEDRPDYIRALQEPGPESFDRLLYQRLDATLGDYLNALKEALPASPPPSEGRRPVP
jgi:Fic family protein